MPIDLKKLKKILNIDDGVSLRIERTYYGFRIRVDQRISIPKILIKELISHHEENGIIKCLRCKRNLTKKYVHWHHIIPRSRGGKDIMVNIIPLCFDCHIGDNAIHNDRWHIVDYIGHNKYSAIAKECGVSL